MKKNGKYKEHPNDTKIKLNEAIFYNKYELDKFRSELPKDFTVIREDDVSTLWGKEAWRLLWHQPVRSFYIWKKKDYEKLC